MDFEPDFDALLARRVAALLQRLADLFERLFVRYTLDKRWAAPSRQAAEVVRQLAPTASLLDVFLDPRGLGVVVLARRAEAEQAHPEFSNACAPPPAVLGEREFHAVLVRGAQFDGLKPRVAVLDDGFDVPVLGQLVGDQTQMERRCGPGWSRRRAGLRRPAPRPPPLPVR